MKTTALLIYLMVAVAPVGQNENMEMRLEVYPTLTACTAQKTKQLAWYNSSDPLAKKYRVYDVRCIPLRSKSA